eukprot:gb/GECG01004212.1/.p1 GENE.gb/GECG01004212.1/~~gb/GECG01004212.1/.p1  ORF type:complete len:123 (+),score=4.72 gb/GECG01004212.1/:1-369(+)
MNWVIYGRTTFLQLILVITDRLENSSRLKKRDWREQEFILITYSGIFSLLACTYQREPILAYLAYAVADASNLLLSFETTSYSRRNEKNFFLCWCPTTSLLPSVCPCIFVSYFGSCNVLLQL